MLKELKGTISDGIGDYAPRSHCSWAIDTQIPNDSITISFSSFNLESQRDFVKIYDGLSPDPATLLIQLTGSIRPQTVSSSGPMLIEFTSDVSIERSGFEATYISRCHSQTPRPNPFTIGCEAADFLNSR